MFTVPNILSFSRGPLAFLFLSERTELRFLAILLAMLTDVLDGYLARRYKSTSFIGSVLDPAMDKFFVTFALVTFVSENQLSLWQAASLVSRDFALCLFGIYLKLSGLWSTFKFYSPRWGKVSTALQFLVLIGLTAKIQFPWFIYTLFIVFGFFVLIELYSFKKTS